MSKGEKKKKWYRENIEHVKEYNRQYRLDNPERYMFRCAANNAQQSGREFTIELEDIKIPKVCPVLGIPIQIGFLDTRQNQNDNSPSLDRLDNSKGYTKDNINVISWKANKLKGSAKLEDLKRVVVWMESKSGA